MSAENSSVTLAVVSAEADVAPAFIGVLCGTPGAIGATTVENTNVSLVSAGATESGINQGLQSTDGAIILAHNLDALTLEETKSLYDVVAGKPRANVAIALYRSAGETEFKTSCPACSQKLLVRDADIGKVAHCPHCKESMRLPMPDARLKLALDLPRSAYVHQVSAANRDTAVKAIKDVVQRATRVEQMLKSQTMRIRVE